MEIPILIAILVVTFLAFSLDWMPIDVVALTSLALLLVFDLITAEQAISGFSNPAVITVMMMFILSQALIHTGLVRRFGQKVSQLAGTSSWLAIASLLVVGGVLSAFINNTAAVALFLPLGLQLSRHYGISASKILLPLSYLSIVGGSCTLIGTSTNLLVSALAEDHGEDPFRVFEFLPLGSVLFVIGGAYTLLLVRLLPARVQPSDLTGKYRLGNYLTELRIPSGSRLAGQTVVDAHLNERFQLNVLEVLRGAERIAFDLRSLSLEGGDVLIVRGAMEGILSFREQYGLLLLTDVKLEDKDLAAGNNILVEVQLSPLSRLNGRTIKEIDFRRRFGCFVLALNRTGEMIREKLTSIELRQWDTLLVFGPRSRVESLYRLDDAPGARHPPLAAAALVGRGSDHPGGRDRGLARPDVDPQGVDPRRRRPAAEPLDPRAAGLRVDQLDGDLPAGRHPAARDRDGEHRPGRPDRRVPGVGGALARAVRGPLPGLSRDRPDLRDRLQQLDGGPDGADRAHRRRVPGTRQQAAPDDRRLRRVGELPDPDGYQTNAMVYGPGGYRFTDYVIYGAPIKIMFWLVSMVLIPIFWPLTAG
ncbi:MAG TPA: SLC13 family permease [Thermoanaerobaculia bacterium]|nr:SLC13 family permease [Thermoanaerobaculia bacterium]